MAKKRALPKVLNPNSVSHVISGWSGQVKSLNAVKPITANDQSVDTGGSPGQVKQPISQSAREINQGTKQPAKEIAVTQPETETEKIPVIQPKVTAKQQGILQKKTTPHPKHI